MSVRIHVNVKDISITEAIKIWKIKNFHIIKDYRKGIEYIKPSIQKRKKIKKAIKTSKYFKDTQ